MGVTNKLDVKDGELSRALVQYEKQFQSLPYRELPRDLNLEECISN